MCDLTNLDVLCFVLGWQGGTLEQVRQTLAMPYGVIENATAEQMHSLCRIAQMHRHVHDATVTLLTACESYLASLNSRAEQCNKFHTQLLSAISSEKGG